MFTLQQTLLSSPTIHVVQPGGSSSPAMCVESLRSEKSELSTSNLHWKNKWLRSGKRNPDPGCPPLFHKNPAPRTSVITIIPEAPRAEKFFFKTGGPPYLRVWMTPPPLGWPPPPPPPPHPTYLKVCIRHCPEYCFLSQSRICNQILANLASRVAVKSRIPLRSLESRKSFQTLKKRVVPDFRKLL